MVSIAMKGVSNVPKNMCRGEYVICGKVIYTNGLPYVPLARARSEGNL